MNLFMWYLNNIIAFSYLTWKIGHWGKNDSSNDCMTLLLTQEQDIKLVAYTAAPNQAMLPVKVMLIPVWNIKKYIIYDINLIILYRYISVLINKEVTVIYPLTLLYYFITLSSFSHPFLTCSQSGGGNVGFVSSTRKQWWL